MLNLTTALGRNGLQDWVLQRVSAVILAAYSIFLLTFWLLNTSYDPIPWQVLFSFEIVRYSTVLALLAVLVHAWIGIWIVSTDYVKSASLRLIILFSVYGFLLFNLIWCLQILWGF